MFYFTDYLLNGRFDRDKSSFLILYSLNFSEMLQYRWILFWFVRIASIWALEIYISEN